MDMQAINSRYIALLEKFGLKTAIITIDDPDLPTQQIIEDSGQFIIRLNSFKFSPDLSYESYVAYNARRLLLPRLMLETDRLVLRRLQMDDAAACFTFLSDQEGMYLDCCAPFESMDAAYYERVELFTQRESQYGIELKATGQVIGTINVFADDSRAVDAMEIGYAVSPAYQRKGYAYEALSALIGLLQNELQLELIVAGTLEENLPSAKLLEKLGFQKEGLRHKAIWHEGLNRPVDLQYYYLDKT